MPKIFEGFKNFILRGNAVDLAVGVVIGASFGTVVTTLVKCPECLSEIPIEAKRCAHCGQLITNQQ